MKFGDFEITPFVERKFRLDGGSMFGVIPKTMWERLIPADERNLIPMQTNLFVLRANGKVMLFDAGLGDSLTEREEKIYNIDSPSHLESSLETLGLTPEQIDVVILTHLHTDHAAGAVKREGDRFVPRFPSAELIASRKEWTAAANPNERTSAVYVPERYDAIEQSGRLRLIDHDTELFPGIRAVHTGGHTEGHFGLEIESGGRKVWYYADTYPTAAHLKTAFVPATDLYPLDTMEIKRKLLPQIIEQQVVLAFDHDTKTPLATVTQDGKKLVITSVN